ncbi:MAG: acyltransferase [Rudaea sp.]|nr:acyltransferase [Rudaea sp.]
MSAHWSQRREGGSRVAIAVIIAIGRNLGRRCARLLLHPITLYFFLRRGPERRASRAYLRRVLGRPAGILAVLRHMHSYAATILDRLFLLAGPLSRFDVRVHGLDQLEAQIAHGRGVLLLGAHIGSFEVLRALAEARPDIRVSVVMDRQQTPAMTELLHALNPAVAEGVIDAGQDSATIAMAIRDAALRGELIGLLADRARPREATCDAMFFGAAAQFPVAPYLIASMLDLPSVLCFGLYRGGNRYELHFETFAESIRIARSERAVRLAEWTQRYALRLEFFTRLDPYNWFNFYDFWHHPVDDRAVAGAPVTGHSAA